MPALILLLATTGCGHHRTSGDDQLWADSVVYRTHSPRTKGACALSRCVDRLVTQDASADLSEHGQHAGHGNHASHANYGASTDNAAPSDGPSGDGSSGDGPAEAASEEAPVNKHGATHEHH